MKIQQLIKEMTNVDQIPDRLTVLAHGQMVKERVFDLINLLKNNTSKMKWKIPCELIEHRDLFLNSLPSKSQLYLYTVMHDCGKPDCYTKDDCG